MADMDRRTLLRLGILGGGAVALLPWGGRAMAGPAATAAGARQLADGPVPTGGKMLANTGFHVPGPAPVRPRPGPRRRHLRPADAGQQPVRPERHHPATRRAASASVLTYFGQFVDHDNFLDLVPQPTALFSRDNQGNLLDPDGAIVQNFESFRFDLSFVYGGGPDISPQLYEADKLHFRLQEPNPNGVRDLPRNPDEHRHPGRAPQRRERDHRPGPRRVPEVPQRRRRHAAHQLRRHLRHGAPLLPVDRHPPVPPAHLRRRRGLRAARRLDPVALQAAATRTPPWSPRRCRWPRTGSGTRMVRKAYEVTTTTGKLQVFNGTAADLHGGRQIPAGREIDWGNFARPLMRPENAAHFNVPRFVDTLISQRPVHPADRRAGRRRAHRVHHPAVPEPRCADSSTACPVGQDVARAMGETVIAADRRAARRG